jgi:hypothetical protein
VGEGASFAAPVKTEVKLQDAPLALEALPPANEGVASSTQLLVSYANGTVDCITPDGTRIDWKYSGDGSSKPSIEHATIVDFDTAKKGILKERQDLATAVSASISGSSLSYKYSRFAMLRSNRPEAPCQDSTSSKPFPSPKPLLALRKPAHPGKFMPPPAKSLSYLRAV